MITFLAPQKFKRGIMKSDRIMNVEYGPFHELCFDMADCIFTTVRKRDYEDIHAWRLELRAKGCVF